MQPTPPEIIIANIAFIVFWALVVVLIWFVGQRFERTRAFRERMMAQWKPALAITVIFLISNVLSGRNPLNVYALAIFCQALIGLALTRSIAGYEPLKTTQAILRCQRIVRNVVLFIVISVIAGVAGLLIGTFGLGIAQSIFHESNYSREAAQSFSIDKAQAFFQFLWGAGIAEETTYRFVALSFVWATTGRRWLAIFVSAILFGVYHLTPLSGNYLTFLKFPVSQLVASMFVGIVWGYVYIKRGYEIVVLSHAMSNWIPVLLFL